MTELSDFLDKYHGLNLDNRFTEQILYAIIDSIGPIDKAAGCSVFEKIMRADVHYVDEINLDIITSLSWQNFCDIEGKRHFVGTYKQEEGSSYLLRIRLAGPTGQQVKKKEDINSLKRALDRCIGFSRSEEGKIKSIRLTVPEHNRSLIYLNMSLEEKNTNPYVLQFNSVGRKRYTGIIIP